MWKKLLTEINSAGFCDAQIAKLTKSSQPTIWRLRNGVSLQPFHDLGERIKSLHFRLLLKNKTPK
jgi:hypothetical protein